MSDAEPRAGRPPEGDAPHDAPAAAGSGILQDPVVRIMTYASLGLLALFLATAVGALFTGVIAPRDVGPRSAAERELMTAAAVAQAGGVTGSEWAPYIDALVATGDLQKARVTLDAARASVAATQTAPELELSEARLEFAQGRYQQAVRAGDAAMKGFEARQATRLAAGGDSASRAEELGIENDYYLAALVKAYSYGEMDQWNDAVEMFDVYITQHPTASDVLIDRGNAKAELKDNTGAEADFREALRFVPYDEEAKAGLERVGAVQ